MFVLERFLGIISSILNKIISCMTAKSLVINEFSNNLLKELNFDDLQMEYS
jgi:hypothetical protein